MAGIFEKIRVLVLSTTHSVLDAAIDMNSTQAVKQHIRDLEDARDELRNAAAEARGEVVGLGRERDVLREKIADVDHDITVLITDQDPSNDHLAEKLQAALFGLKVTLEITEEGLAAALENAQSLAETISKLEIKHVSMVAQLRKLETMERAAKAQEKGASAIRQAVKVTKGGADASVDSVAARIQRRYDVAGEKLHDAKRELDEQSGSDPMAARVAAALAERKAKLAGQEKAP